MNTLGLSWHCLKLDYSPPSLVGAMNVCLSLISFFLNGWWMTAKLVSSPYYLVTILCALNFLGWFELFLYFQWLSEGSFLPVLGGQAEDPSEVSSIV